MYSTDRLSEFNAACTRFIEERVANRQPTYLPLGVCYEYLRVSTHPGVSDHPQSGPEAGRFLDDLLSEPNFRLLIPTDRHFEMLTQTLSELTELRGNVMHDVHTAVLMRENGIREICTRDADFYRFPFLTVVDPLRA